MRTIYYGLFFLLVNILSCTKHTGPYYQLPAPPFLQLATVTTTSISGITSTGALSGGNIVDDGGTPITVRGVCWSTSHNPTVSLPGKTIDGSGIGAFSSTIAGLTTGETYYVRAYATNSAGTAYGTEAGFVATTQPTVPVVITLNAAGITTSSAYCGGEVTSEGNVPVTSRGLCWSMNFNPSLADNVITAGNGPGLFNASITGLSPATTYHVRAYATNSISTAYGTDISFTTANTPPPPSTVTICSQVWMTKNLDVTVYRNGDPIPQVTDPVQWKNLTTGAWTYVNGDPSTNATYGKMYNWYAVNDPRGLAPAGWHIPSNGEYATLANCVGGIYAAGGPLKTMGTSDWMSPNTGASNSSGFSALPGGMRTNQGIYINFGTIGSLWTSTQAAANTGLAYNIFYSSVNTSFTADDKIAGLPVRLVKD